MVSTNITYLICCKKVYKNRRYCYDRQIADIVVLFVYLGVIDLENDDVLVKESLYVLYNDNGDGEYCYWYVQRCETKTKTKTNTT